MPQRLVEIVNIVILLNWTAHLREKAVFWSVKLPRDNSDEFSIPL